MAACGRIRRFFSPGNSLRIVELLYAIFVVSFSYGWSDKGVNYSDLNGGDYDECNSIIFVMMVGMISLVFLLCVCLYSIMGKILAPCKDIVANGVLSLLMFIAAIVLSHTLSKLGKSQGVREAGISFGSLQTALVFGIALAMLFALSAAFAVCFYRKRSDFMLNDSRTTMADLPDDIPT
ncbi:uncharacterized protein LOC101848610 [Aplysia californica]|uniref:Uncharacterized protein LOC101848610 n=1 Tax=Aplysia californica TaxID=6500 RepID=A0ABM0K363_APLCA|nr:uncharacterized protein LOC101848610 [Aplysia californica]